MRWLPTSSRLPYARMAGADVRISLCLSVLLLAACAGRAQMAQPTASPPKRASATESAQSAEPRVDAQPQVEAESQAALSLVAASYDKGKASKDAVLGVIDRAGLVAIVDAGLGRLFQQLKVSPSMKKRRFVGFQITAMHPHWASSTLQTGDVVTALNGMPVERPEQAMAAFESLRTAEQLVVSLLRAGSPVTVRFRIE